MTEYQSGRHFLQIPGPSNVPDRILRAMDRAVLDHRGPEFAELASKALQGMRSIFRTEHHVVMFPASGTGAWEAALMNTLSPGDTVLMAETGQFAALWIELAKRFDLKPDVIAGDWRHGADAETIEARLREDRAGQIKAVCIVHNETSTGCVSDIAAVRAAIDAAQHPALLLVDTISSLGSLEYRMDDWGVDVTITGSQKGLMLPPGLSFNAISPRAVAAMESAKLPRSYWNWKEHLKAIDTGYFPYTPATTLVYGLLEALEMLHEEGLDNVYARHARHGTATRKAVEAWGLEILCADPTAYSDILTGVMMPQGEGADRFRRIVLESFDMSLGAGLGRLADKIFRIGHLGHFNDLMLSGTLVGVEMGLARSGVAYQRGGVQAAIDYLAATHDG